MDLEGKSALITGASRGIGREISRELAGKGANLIINFKSSEEATKELAEELRERHDVTALPAKADVGDPAQCSKLVERAHQQLDTLDVLVNNAGILKHGPFEKTGISSIEEMVDVNLTGLMCLTHEAIPVMKRQGEGDIVNISSGAGKTGFSGLAAYCATKFGVLGFNEALGKELEGTDLRTHTVCPGGVDTDMYREIDPDAKASNLISPEKIARAVRKVITGETDVKNGGDLEVYW